MRPAAALGTVAMALVLAAAAVAEPAAVPAAATPRIHVTGTFKLNGSFTVAKVLTTGTPVSASIFIQTSDTTYSNSSGIQAQAKVSGGKVRFTAKIPYSWLLAKATDPVMVTINLSGTAFSSAGSFFYTSYLTKTIGMPKNGATTTVNFTGSL